MSSGSGSGADQHLLALLRAIRLRQAAPDAVAAGIADTVEALREQEAAAHGHPQALPALPPAEPHEALPPATARPGLPAGPPHPGAPGRSGGDSSHPGAPVPFTGEPPHPGAAGRSGGDSSHAGAAGRSGGEPDGAAGPAPGRSFWSRNPVRPVASASKGPYETGGTDDAALESRAGEPPAAGTLGAGRAPVSPGRAVVPVVADDFALEAVDHGLLVRPVGLPPIEPPVGPAVSRLPSGAPGPSDDQALEAVDHGQLVRPAGLPPIDPEPHTGADPRPPVFTPLIDPARTATRPGSFFARESREEPRRPGAHGDAGAEGRPGASDRDESPGANGPQAGKTLMTPEEAGRFADVEAVGRPNRNQFAGLPVRRPPGEVRPVAWPQLPQVHEVEGGARPEWASGGGHRVRDEGESLQGESQTESGTRTPAPRLPGFDMPHVMPPMVARRDVTGDGMDPADDALLLETQRLLATSLTFAGGPDEVAERLRAALLQAHPSLLTTIPGGAETQTAQLARALTWLVHHLDRPPILVEGTGRLGAALSACGVEPGHLQLVGAALAEAMRAGMAPGQWRQDFDLAWRSTWQHAYEWIAHGWTRAGYEPPVWDATVVAHELRRPDLAVVRLRPTLPMPFRPGQFARIQVPGLPAIWRPYSLSGAPRRNDLIELHVRAKTTTGVSGTLVHNTQVGDPVRLSRAEGAMTLPADPARNLLMIAGDTGVAPLKALLTELADTGDPRSAVLFWGVRDLDELYDIDEIAAVARAARRATVVPVVSEGDPGPYASGLVTDAVAAYGEWSDHEVYLAGPPLMLAATSVALQQLGVAPSRIHHDPPE
ncbi:hypothetical protein Aab01nite_42810 [Paractinoplanes abujensis]|uniref:hypothetical protein n=1 Tax=Paractinoplanes abujensis TaxID=882441 RepID=UPI001A40381A|nr:hypothetical protein [Actinoplanes abujensis]GID20691.1 hypothetical protein Aab01nite_42810 [Actinoplanes abujensis]